MNDRPSDGRASVRRTLAQFIRPHAGGLALALVAVAVEGLTDLLDPWPLKIVVDYVLGDRPPPAWLAAFAGRFGTGAAAMLDIAIVATLGIAATNAVSGFAGRYLTTAGQQIGHDLPYKVYGHLQRLSLSYFDRHHSADLTSRIMADVDTVQDFVSSTLLGAIVDVLTLGGMVGVMLYVNWRFAVVALSVAPALGVVAWVLTIRIKRAARLARAKEGEIASIVQETLSSIRLVQAFGRAA
jgi:ATP-binding cassette, subfamily B, bacterial